MTGGQHHGETGPEPRRDDDRQRSDVPLSEAGPDEKALPGQRLRHQPESVLQDQHDARRTEHEPASGGNQGLFRGQDRAVHCRDHPQQVRQGVPAHRLPGQEAPGLVAAGGRTGTVRQEDGVHETLDT